MKKLTSSVLIVLGLMGSTLLSTGSAITASPETPNPDSTFERSIHQQLEDGENAIRIFINPTDAFLEVSFNVFTFNENPTTGISTLDSDQSSNPYASGDAIALAPESGDLGGDYKGYRPYAPRVNIVSVCMHPDHLYGHCLQANAFYDVGILTEGDVVSVLVPPGGEVWANPFRDYFDGIYSNNSGVVAYKVESMSILYRD